MASAPTSATLCFAEDYASDALRLLEVPKELEHIFTALAEGKNADDKEQPLIVLRGIEGDAVTLHTYGKSFSVKEVHTSNSVLVVEQPRLSDQKMDELEDVWTVREILSNVLEVNLCAPTWGYLRVLLRESTFEGEEMEDRSNASRRYTYADIRQVIQASDMELNKALERMDAVLIGDHYRLLSPAYMQEVLSLLFNTAVAEGWPLETLSCFQCEEALQIDGVLPIVTRHVLRAFSNVVQPQNNQTAIGVDVHYSICPRIVNKFMAKQLLGNNTHPSGRWKLNSFLDIWREHVPEQFEIDQSVLKDVAVELTDSVTGEIYLQYVPVEHLSSTPSDRMADLFRIKPTWTREEMTPFITDLVLERSKLEPLLMKHARSVKTKNGICYVSRSDRRN